MDCTFETVRTVALALLDGAVLHACNVSAGNGIVIDWRTCKNGATVQENGDAFDTALLLITLVGAEKALAAVTKEAAPAPAEPTNVPRVHAFMQQANGGRLRSFEVDGFRVMVEAHPNDEAQAAFTEMLAKLASTIPTHKKDNADTRPTISASKG